MKPAYLPLITALVLLSGPAARAATYYVAANGSDANPGTAAQPFQHIQHGIDATGAGDTVVVQAGTYSGSGNTPLLIQRDITVTGAGGPGNCIIDGGAAGRCIRIDNGVSSACVLQGFTVRNGYCSDTVDGDPRGAGLFINNASPTIRHCVFSGNIVENKATGEARGGAVYVTTTASASQNSSPSFLNCTFSNNQATTHQGAATGGALAMAAGGTLTMSDCVVSGNKVLCSDQSGAAQGYGGGVDVSTAANLLRCDFTSNDVSAGWDGQSGGGGALASHGYITISACHFTANTAHLTSSNNGGGYYETGGSCILKNSTFWNNIASGGGASGGGAALYSGGAVVNVAVYGNIATGGVAIGGGISAGGNTVSILNCSFADNRAQGTVSSVGGGFCSGSGNTTTIENAAFDRNSAKSGGEFAAWNNGTTHGSINVSYSLARGSITGPVTLGPGMIYLVNDPSPFVDPYGGNLHEAAGAKTIDAGDSSVTNFVKYDLEGHARQQGAGVDIGAYESGSAPALDFYVDRANGSDTTGAGTPDSPFQTVAQALAYVNDPLEQAVVHVAAGNYATDRPRVTNQVKFVNWNNTGRAAIGKQ